jgi:hypothetical protein
MRLHRNSVGVRFAFPAALVGGILVFSLIQSNHFQLFGSPVGYGYGLGSSQPWINTVSPANGAPAGGQTVTITGGNFTIPVTVKFGNTPAVVTNTTPTTVTVTTPAHAEGIVDVIVTNTGGGLWQKTNAYAYVNGVYTLDAYGGVHADGGSPAKNSGPYFASKLARAMVLLPGGGGGFVLDGWGGVHPWGTGSISPVQPSGFAYFQGFDIARDIVLTPTSNAAASSGYTLDGWGGIHPFGGAPAIAAGASYFKGFDIAKKIVLFPDVKGGYVLDGWGGIHPFATGSNAMPAGMVGFGYFQGFNIARDFQLIPGSTESSAQGFTLDGYGGLHPTSTAGTVKPITPTDRPYWGWDIARSVRFAPGSTTAANQQGWILDGWGGIHEVNDAPVPAPFAYFAGQDIAKALDLN